MNKIYEWIDRVWQWIAERVFVRFQFDIPVDRLKEVQPQGRIIFALAHGGLIEWLILSSWARSQGFGAILVVNRKRILLFSKPLYFLQVLFRQKSYADLFTGKEKGPRLIFAPVGERKKPFRPTPVEQLLSDIYSHARSDGSLNSWTFFPILVLWRKFGRGPVRNLSEYLFGLSSNPNLIGKIWYLLRKRTDSTVRALPPFALALEPSSEVGALDEGEGIRVAKTARRKILVETNQEMRVVLGPRYLSPYAVKETLLKNSDIQNTITEVADQEGADRKKVMLRAYQYLSEIVANYRYRYIEVTYVLLTWLFKKMFDAIDVLPEDLQKVREAMKSKPVVFASAHRSHLDYLVIPYVLFEEDMIPPHVAAGINLSFWPAGYFLRMGGAFFIRRSFRGNLLYSVCLRKYIEYLLSNRCNIKFFIEGTRSRSGKLLPPTYGMLKMIMEPCEKKVVDDTAIVPISLCYEEVLEQGAYTKELMGGAKTKESATSLLKSREVVSKNIGRVYVRFGDPMYVKDIIKHGEDTQLDPTLRLQKTAFQICKTINDITPVTPKSLVCAVILTDRMASASLETILARTVQLGKLAEHMKLPVSLSPEANGFRRAIEQTVRKLNRSGLLAISETVPRTFHCEGRKRILLNFYKNNSIHGFVVPAIVTLSFLRTLKKGKDKSYSSIEEEALFLRNLLKFDFFFGPTTQFLEEMKQVFTYLFGDPNHNDFSKWSRHLTTLLTHPEDIGSLQRILGDVIESYLVTLHYIKESSHGEFDRKTLAQRILKFGQSKNDEGEIAFPESINLQNYTTALQLLENMKLIEVINGKEKTVLSISGWSGEMQELANQLEDILALMEDSAAKILRT